ncbi:phage major capsid protein, P2 family [Telmatospirillum sp. J64-1]|uniref:phage major capsid protein, P2 family n=1 Tax=Telmatospirillum sp. J64-1 TaxID=2502183 RepID=UPI00115EFAFA|nr:phage major capsid protein, P2 family [Telmatospirillum sp. J64-1]
MRNETRVAFNAYAAQLAQLNGVPNVTTKFNVAPTVAQKLEDRIQESADFLKAINIIPVDQQTGETLGLGTNSRVAGRTNTDQADRQTRSITNMRPKGYACVQTNFDTHLKYAHLDAWAKFPDFQTRIRNHVTQQVARDRLTIGWHGTHAAPDTDLGENPMLQDVNKGWLQHIRDDAEERVLAGVKIGPGGDYTSFDAAVFDAVNSLLDEWHREDADLIVIIGSGLLTDKYMGLIESAASTPTEHVAMSTLLHTRTVGGRKAMTVPFFPGKSILITKPENLSIYWQNGTHRRHIADNPKRDRIEDYLSVNEAYVVEDYGAAALIEGILVPDGAGGWM